MGEFWIVIALVIYVASFAAGAGFFGPESGRISTLVRVEGADSPDAQARTRRILMLSRLELVLLVLAVLDMAAKPTSGDTGVIVVGFRAGPRRRRARHPRRVTRHDRGLTPPRQHLFDLEIYAPPGALSNSTRSAPAATRSPSTTCTALTFAS